MAPEALSADFDSIWTSVSVWKGGSMVKRITQNSPMRCSVTPCQFFSSIPPSILPSFARSSFHLPVCGYLCPFLPPSRRYCPSVACFPHPSPFSLRHSPITISNLRLGTQHARVKRFQITFTSNQVQVKNASRGDCLYSGVKQPAPPQISALHLLTNVA